MRMLWQRMAEIYGHRWTSNFGDDAGNGAGQTWSKGLAGLTIDHIRIGINALLSAAEPWPPSLPEFRAICFAIPSFSSVLAMVRAKQSTPFVRLVWSHLDGYRFRYADQASADRLLRDAYEVAKEHVMRGGALPPEPRANLAAPKTDAGTPATKETAQKHLDGLAKLFATDSAGVTE